MKFPAKLPAFFDTRMLPRWPFIIAILIMIVMCLGAAVWLGIHLIAIIGLSLYTRLQYIWTRIRRRKLLPRS